MSLGNCASCGVSFKGAPIDPKHFVWPDSHNVDKWCIEAQGRWGSCVCLPYGDLPEDERFYSTLMGIELAYDHPKHYDGVSYWQCQSCGFTWDRWTGEAVDPSTLVA